MATDLSGTRAETATPMAPNVSTTPIATTVSFALALNAVIPMRMVLAIVGVYRVAVIRALKRERAMSPRTDA